MFGMNFESAVSRLMGITSRSPLFAVLSDWFDPAEIARDEDYLKVLNASRAATIDSTSEKAQKYIASEYYARVNDVSQMWNLKDIIDNRIRANPDRLIVLVSYLLESGLRVLAESVVSFAKKKKAFKVVIGLCEELIKDYDHEFPKDLEEAKSEDETFDEVTAEDTVTRLHRDNVASILTINQSEVATLIYSLSVLSPESLAQLARNEENYS
jgi:hypothetical protein